MMETCFIYMTTQDKSEARRIGRYLVESRLAACVNILDQMNAMYIWQGEFKDDQEAVMIAKTTKEKVPDLIAAVKARHSYEVPCIVSLPIADGSPEFLEWVAGQVNSNDV